MGRKSIGWKNLWSLTVLVFLRLRPMHPYQLQSIIRITHKEDFLRLNPGSLYNSIERLAQAGLIVAAATTRSGRRPERTIYRITSKGRAEAVRWLRELLQTPAPDSTWFFAALSFLPALQPRDARGQLQKRVGRLHAELQNYRHVVKALTPTIGRLSLIELEYAEALRAAELKWVERIVQELKTGKLRWDPRQNRRQAERLFTTCMPAAAVNC